VCSVPTLLDKILTPEEGELARKKAILTGLEAQLADRELELASLLTDLILFEKHYLQTVGRRYAILDDLKAQIAEARARRNPRKEDAHEMARAARSKARESAQAAGEDANGSPLPKVATPAEPPKRSESLQKLYRRAAFLLHPDRTLDPAEKEIRHHFMAELNETYAKRDEDRIRAILHEWESSPDSVKGDGPGAELIRIIRTIAQVERRLKTIASEMEQRRAGELFKLWQAVEEARGNGRNLLKDLGESLDGEIAEMKNELKRESS
jgi:hypothetical protein